MYVPPLTVAVTVTLTPLDNVVLWVALVEGDVRRLTPEQAVTLAKVVAAEVAAGPAAQARSAARTSAIAIPNVARCVRRRDESTNGPSGWAPKRRRRRQPRPCPDGIAGD